MYSLLAMLLWLARLLAPNAAGGARPAPRGPRGAAKPAWVRDEVLRLKALMPEAGCRSIELIFNRRFALARGVSIGKTYVARVLVAHRYELQARERSGMHCMARIWPHNARWGVDLTSFRDSGRRYWILGVIEYRSRALLALIVLLRKSAAAIAHALALAFERFGAPRTLVTDNEGPFRSALCRRLLARAGVLHRRIVPYCPWQNGRIERLFGTLKPRLRRRGAQGSASLQRDLDVFRHWYNRVRPHQALGVSLPNGARSALTPAEAWHAGANQDRGVWFEGWNGILRGYAWRI